MVIKIPQTKQEAFAQLDALLGEEDKRELAKGDAKNQGTVHDSSTQSIDFPNN